MRSPRIQSPKAHWKAVGRITAHNGLDAKIVLTGKATYDRWIMEGFHEFESTKAWHAKRLYDLVELKASEA